ncbi:hypothetical protein RR11_3019 [Ruegeria sp. R11]|nr:hypothetical protein RR11_3019 [Ruegeria sp. R11]
MSLGLGSCDLPDPERRQFDGTFAAMLGNWVNYGYPAATLAQNGRVSS